MNSRIIKEDKKGKCPVTIVFGKSRFWGSYYHSTKKKPATFIAMFIKDVTPRVFDELLEHEMLHQVLYMVKENKRWTMHQEHWLIDKVLQAREEWI